MTEDELDLAASELLEESMRINNCVRSGRHYCCSYHAGFEDAIDSVLEMMAHNERT